MMDHLRRKLEAVPIWARALPFFLFSVLTFLQGVTGTTGPYWMYLLKTLIGAWTVWLVWPLIPEMRWKISWEAVVVGVAVFFLWVGLDEVIAMLGVTKPFHKMSMGTPGWTPHAVFAPATALFFNLVRIAGSTLVVPFLEEVFFRSLIYRYIINANFLSVPLGRFALMPLVVTSLLFGFGHKEWLAGFLCGLIYQGLVIRKDRLGDAISAHAITNLLLGIYVVYKGAWQFW